MTPSTRKPPNPSGRRGAPKRALRAGEKVTSAGRVLKVATRKKPKPPKKNTHIPGHPLDIDSRILTEKTSPVAFSIDMAYSSWGYKSIFIPSIDKHYGIFIDGEDKFLKELVENIVCSDLARHGIPVWQAPARIVDCTPDGKFSAHNFRQKVVSNCYHAHLPGQQAQVVEHLCKVVQLMHSKCVNAGYPAPPKRVYDLFVIWLDADQAEELAVHHEEVLAYLLENAGTMNLPVIFIVEGEAARADTFVKMLTRAIFIGEANKEYIHDTINRLVEETTGNPVSILDTPPSKYPLGYEPVWSTRKGTFVLASIYTLKHHGISLKSLYQEEAKNNNRLVWDDFLTSLTYTED